MNTSNGIDPHPLKREQLHQQLELGRRELRGDSTAASGTNRPHQPRSLTMRYLLANTEPSPRLLILLTALLAAFRLFRAINTGLALLRKLGLLQAPALNRLPAPKHSQAALP